MRPALRIVTAKPQTAASPASALRTLRETLLQLGAVLDAQANALETADSAAPPARAAYTLPTNCLALFGRRFRAIDEWASKHGVPRLRVAGSPAYETAALDALAVETGRTPSPIPVKVDADSEYAALAKKRAR